MTDSSIVKFDEADILLELASEFDIKLDENNYSGSNRIFTNLTTIPDIRVLQSSWQEGTASQFQWNIPGQAKEYIEEWESFPIINQLGGFILYSEIQPNLAESIEKEGEGSRTNTVCSLTGYRKGDEYIQAVPETATIYSMYNGWDKVNKTPNLTSPAKIVEEMEFLGSRGKSCAQCIRDGDSVIRDANGKVIKECNARGRLFFWVTDVYKTKKNPPKSPTDKPTVTTITKSIRELTGEPGILLMINLANKTGLKGVWSDEEEDRRIAYFRYLTGLRIKYAKTSPYRVSPYMNYTTISIRPPEEGKMSKKNFLHFEESPSFDSTQLREARQKWAELFPKKEPTILDPNDWIMSGSNGERVLEANVIETNAITAGKAELEEEFF